MESELQRGAQRGDGSSGLKLRKPTPFRALPGTSMDSFLSNRSDALPSPILLPEPQIRPFSFSSPTVTPSSPSSSALQVLGESSVERINTDKQFTALRKDFVECLTGFSEIASNELVSSARAKRVSTPGALRFKATPPSRLPISRSNHVPISPSLLLDSPVLFASQQDKASPTTGKFLLAPPDCGQNSQPSSLQGASESASSIFFKSSAKPLPHSPLQVSMSLVSGATFNHQAVRHVQSQAQTSHPSSLVSVPSPTSSAMAVSLIPLSEVAVPLQVLESATSIALDKNEQKKLTEYHTSEDQDHQSPNLPVCPENTSADGYNWRKYGQKQVKGRENPRSYYKCTYPNCPMKKKVERSLDGQVTEIMYRGAHNHAKPQCCQRTVKVANGNLTCTGRDGGPNGKRIEQNRWSEGELSSKLQHHSIYPLNSNCELSSASASVDEERSKLVARDGDEDEHGSKRRRSCEDTQGSILVPKTICEPRVVRVENDGDVSNDGYRWRKYGQKVVKGNSHPRSYYKCTSIGCPVRKHVQRSPTDPNLIITTSEGNHNHDMPAARTGSNDPQIFAASPSAAQSITSMSETAMKNSIASHADLAIKVVSIVARHREKAKVEADEIAYRFKGGLQNHSSCPLVKETNANFTFDLIKSEPTSSSAAQSTESDSICPV